jgi:hypothetical protein
MPPCNCKYNRCNGAQVPARTQRDHAKRDRIFALKASLGSRTPFQKLVQPPAPAQETPLDAHPLPTSPIFPLPPPTLKQPCSPPRCPSPPAPNPSNTLQSGLGDHILAAELQDRAAAEERGRDYEEHATLLLDHLDELGDLDEIDESSEPPHELQYGPGLLNGPELTTTMGARPEGGASAPCQPHLDELPLRTAPAADPRYPGENSLDPFRVSSTIDNVNSTKANTMSTPLYILYMLVAWLHAQYHLAFKACNVVLVVIAHIIAADRGACPCGHEQPHASYEAPYLSLTSVIAHLGIEPIIQVLPVCPSCSEPHPSGQLPDALCTRCLAPLFKHSKGLNQRQRHAEDITQPCLQYPHMNIEDQLRSILDIPGMEDEMERWRYTSRTRGKYKDMFDGRIPREIKGHDGRPFFENPAPGDVTELRIGLVLGFDWYVYLSDIKDQLTSPNRFSYLRSQISASHTSGPMSFNIANLKHHLRYQFSNLIVTGILPGPKEQDADQVQRFVRIIVNKLIRLWVNGFWVKTTKYPLGRLVRVILLCVCCDKPAAHKLGGFGSHSHTFFCTRCWIRQQQKATKEAFQRGGVHSAPSLISSFLTICSGFRARTHDEQLKYAQEYASCPTQAARDAFVKQHASRWFELARLPYFDVTRMIIIDPMHNLLLGKSGFVLPFSKTNSIIGLVKTHFYHIWIQLKVLRKTKELRRFHDILSKVLSTLLIMVVHALTVISQLQIPTYLGRVPALMGDSAGGSLTADQWLIAAIAVCPVAVRQLSTPSLTMTDVLQIPQIWDEYCTGDPEEVRLR